jgi:FkbM family methyltransferase
MGKINYLEENIFKGFNNGIFVDVGAHDGVSLNNTLFFEKEHGWKGINVEVIPDVFNKLSANRPNCININCAIDNNDGEAEFIYNKGYSEMISGLKHSYDERHFMRLARDTYLHGGESFLMKVQTRRLQPIFDELNYKHIHYLSIDVEGNEFNVIKSIDFSKTFADVIGFEDNYPDTSVGIIEYLKENGFLFLKKHDCDIFMINQNSEFIENM